MKQPYVLVIDDDVWQCDIYQQTAQRHNIATQQAATLNQAMAHIMQQPPVAIVADILLAGETIFTLLNELQSDTVLGSIPVVLCSNMTQQLAGVDLADYGVVRSIDKATMHPDDIIVALRAVGL